MRRYLGSKITAFAAVLTIIFVTGPLVFAIAALLSQISKATILIALGCMACSVLWGCYLYQNSTQLYAFGKFQKDGVYVKKPFAPPSIFPYSKCKSVGIGYYVHGVLNSRVGTKVYFIYFSKDRFDEQYREHMNLWKPSAKHIKVAFDRKLYDYLRSVLPPEHVRRLQQDYQKYRIG